MPELSVVLGSPARCLLAYNMLRSLKLLRARVSTAFFARQGRKRRSPDKRRPAYSRSLGCGLLLLSILLACRAEPPPNPINIILISIDSLRADHVHCYGYPRETTPTLDQLAREGALFETVVAESSWTLPSHMTMLTGLSAATHGVEYTSGPALSLRQPTLADLLHEGGYRTWGFFSGPYLHPIFGFGNGFDGYESVIGEIPYDEPDIDLMAGDLETESKIKAAHRMSHRTITSPALTEKAIDFLSERHDTPFFLFLHYFDVHYDYIPPEELWREFDPDYRGALTAENYDRNSAINANMSARDLQHVVALYDGEILFTDRHIGRLIDALDRNGLTQDTLIVVTSDHGQEFFEHGNKGHFRTLYDEVILVPLIMRLPGRIPAGTRIRAQVRHLDLMPTLLALAGLHEPLEGVDLMGVLTERDAPPSRDAMSRMHRNGWLLSVRTPELKYIVRRTEEAETEMLFDLEEDPGEKRPVIRQLLRAGGRSRVTEWERLRGALLKEEARAFQARAKHGWEERTGIELPEDLEERLRSLGYIK